jgi:hypothetical protein
MCQSGPSVHLVRHFRRKRGHVVLKLHFFILPLTQNVVQHDSVYSCYSNISSLDTMNTTDLQVLFKLSLHVSINELSNLANDIPAKLIAGTNNSKLLSNGSQSPLTVWHSSQKTGLLRLRLRFNAGITGAMLVSTRSVSPRRWNKHKRGQLTVLIKGICLQGVLVLQYKANHGGKHVSVKKWKLRW